MQVRDKGGIFRRWLGPRRHPRERVRVAGDLGLVDSPGITGKQAGTSIPIPANPSADTKTQTATTARMARRATAPPYDVGGTNPAVAASQPFRAPGPNQVHGRPRTPARPTPIASRGPGPGTPPQTGHLAP